MLKTNKYYHDMPYRHGMWDMEWGKGKLFVMRTLIVKILRQYEGVVISKYIFACRLFNINESTSTCVVTDGHDTQHRQSTYSYRINQS